MPKQVEIEGVEVELDDDVDEKDLDQGEVSRQDGEVDLDEILKEVEDIEDGDDEYV